MYYSLCKKWLISCQMFKVMIITSSNCFLELYIITLFYILCIYPMCWTEATVGFMHMYEVFLTTTKNTRCLYLLVTVKWVTSLGANFPEWWTLSFSRNFPDLEIHKPTNKKSHMSNILYKVYICKTVICHICAMSTIFIVFHSCMVTTCACVHVYM